jgi:EPS-associated MarR family transcriptional regulator
LDVRATTGSRKLNPYALFKEFTVMTSTGRLRDGYNVQVFTKLTCRMMAVTLAERDIEPLIRSPNIQTQSTQSNFSKFMTSRQAKLQEDTYFRVMRILQENPDLTQRELAGKLGISVGGLNYCLKALIQKGLVKMKSFASSKNKFGYVYILTPTGISEKTAMTQHFLRRKILEYEALQWEIEELRRNIVSDQHPK